MSTPLIFFPFLTASLLLHHYWADFFTIMVNYTVPEILNTELSLHM